jgi:hypothetical protein
MFDRTPKTSHKIVHVHETPKTFYKPSPVTISSGTKRKNPGHLPIGSVQTKKQKVPTPRIGGRPVCIFKLQWGDAPEVRVRALLDSGAMTDVISAVTLGGRSKHGYSIEDGETSVREQRFLVFVIPTRSIV